VQALTLMEQLDVDRNGFVSIEQLGSMIQGDWLFIGSVRVMTYMVRAKYYAL
jgi:hypothetical protein